MIPTRKTAEKNKPVMRFSKTGRRMEGTKKAGINECVTFFLAFRTFGLAYKELQSHIKVVINKKKKDGL